MNCENPNQNLAVSLPTLILSPRTNGPPPSFHAEEHKHHEASLTLLLPTTPIKLIEVIKYTNSFPRPYYPGKDALESLSSSVKYHDDSRQENIICNTCCCRCRLFDVIDIGLPHTNPRSTQYSSYSTSYQDKHTQQQQADRLDVIKDQSSRRRADTNTIFLC